MTEPKVTDKRGGAPSGSAASRAQPKVAQSPDLVDVLIAKNVEWLMKQPEYWMVMTLDRPTRKRLEKAVAKVLTRLPHIKKTGNGETTSRSERSDA